MEALGIDLVWLVFQLGNFALLFAGLYYILHKPVLSLLDERRKEVSDSLASVEKIRQQTEENKIAQMNLQTEMRKESSELMQKAKNQANLLEQKLSHDAQTHAEELLEKAKIQIAQERQLQHAELRKELSEIVITATEKVLGEKISESQKKEQIKRSVDSLDSSHDK